MNLIKWNNPRTLSDVFDDLFDKSFEVSYPRTYLKMPSANIKELDDRFELEIAIPGMHKDDLKISLENSILSVSCEKESERKEDKDNYTRREFAYGAFCRSFNLPKTVDTEKINAGYTDGILHIALPKREEDKSKLSRLINVN